MITKSKLKTILFLIPFLVVGLSSCDQSGSASNEDENEESIPENAARITEIDLDTFDVVASQPLYPKKGGNLYYSADGKVSFEGEPIWTGNITDVFVSPDGKYAIVYDERKRIGERDYDERENEYHLHVLDHEGNVLEDIENCAEYNALFKTRKAGRFLSHDIQWSPNSDYFVIIVDKIFDADDPRQNRKSLFKYFVKDKKWEHFVDINDDAQDEFYLSKDTNYIFYIQSGMNYDEKLIKLNIHTSERVAQYERSDQNPLSEEDKANIFINFKDPKYNFDHHSYDCEKVVVGTGFSIVYQGPDTTYTAIRGIRARNELNLPQPSFCSYFYFLPGNRYHVFDLDTYNHQGTYVLDTETGKTTSLGGYCNIFFNISNEGFDQYKFRGQLKPQVETSTSIANDLSGLGY